MIRRTTVSAADADLEVLEGEARRRGVSLAKVLRELVAKKADEIRSRNRPTFGLFESGIGLADQSWQDEDAPARGD
jgi:hypothetical protein